MDKILADIYGTNQTADASDVEKLAAAEMAEGLAEDNNLDIDGLSADQIEGLAQAVLTDMQGEQETSEQAPQGEEEVDEEVMAKVAEADRLGRVMAHSMWQEMGSIQKEAAGLVDSKGNPISSSGSSAGRAVSRKKDELVASAKKHLGAVDEAIESKADKAAKFIAGKASKGMAAAKSGLAAAKSRGAEAAGKVGTHLAKNKGKYGILGATGLAAAGAHKAMSGGKKKKASALDTLAEARALEILEANGIDPATLEPVQEKTSGADPAEVLTNAVENRAWEMLSEFGIVPADQE